MLAALELARRLMRAELPERLPMDRPSDCARYLAVRYSGLGQEVMGAVFLDVRNRLIDERVLYRGTAHRISVEPRHILKEALRQDAVAVLLFHTHPSGDPSPSAEDMLFTRRFVTAGEVLGVKLVDHIVLGGAGRWVSMRERGGW